MPIEVGSFEYNLLLVLTIILLAGKLLLSIYLIKKVLENKKKRDSFEIDFVFGIFIVILGFFVSRIFFTYFDFVLTKFDASMYYLPQSVLFWKLGGITYLIGLAVLMFIIDKKVLKFKFKGIFTYIILAAVVFLLLYPINTRENFEVVSTVVMIAALIAVIMFPAIFFYLGLKTPKVRSIAFTFAFGIIFFTIGMVLVTETILGPLTQAYGSTFKIIIWIFSLAFKLTGLVMISYSCTKFY